MFQDDSAPLLVLLIEPDPERAERSARALEECGVELVRVASVEEARTRLESELPEALAISGALFAGPGREEVLVLLETPPHLPVLALLEEDDGMPETDRVHDWVRAPFRTGELAARLRSAVSVRDRERDLFGLRSGLSVLQRLGRMGAWHIVPEFGELRLSEAACSLLGMETTCEATSPDVLLSLTSEGHEAEVRTWLEGACAGQGLSSVEFDIEHGDGTVRRVRLRSDMPVMTEEGLTVPGVVQDCTPGLDPDQAAGLVDTNDPITGLPNRKQFLLCLDRAMSVAAETQEQIAVLYLEVDSADVGSPPLDPEERDQLLIEVVQRLGHDLRHMDLLGQSGAELGELGLSRVGNDTLTVLLREQVRSQDAYKVSRRLRQAAEQTFVVDGRDLKVEFNIGIAVYPGDAESAVGLLKCAEEAMYCAKQHGRNNIQFYTTSMNTATFESLTLESTLRRAIECNELTVYYQPKIEIASNRIIGMEALVRWKHPELGMVSPAQFIPIAEETGLIIPIGEFVLRTACEQNKVWQEQGLDPIRMAVNLSSIQFRRPDLFDNVIGVLEDVKLDPEWLELEITESILLKNVDATISTLHRLKRAGIHLSIDDFGTGYSSLSYLKRFPVDTLKIDQSFIREVTSNADDASITTSIILMGHSLKLKVIAEGVETKSQLAFLRVLECDEVQGYYFSAPVPAEEATKLLEGSLAREKA